MKKLSTTIALLAMSLQLSAQCFNIPDMTIIYLGCRTLGDTTIYGDISFYGYGGITESVAIKYAQKVGFNSSTASINVDCEAINKAGVSKIYCSGYSVNFWGSLNINSGDTLFVSPGCQIYIESITRYGAIILSEDAILRYGDNISRIMPGYKIGHVSVLSCSKEMKKEKIVFFIDGYFYTDLPKWATYYGTKKSSK